MIRLGPGIVISDDELQWEFIRSSGPGGQNVNKVSTAVQLRFDVAGSPALSEELKKRIQQLSGKRMTSEGTLIITARRFRSQERNREDALARLQDLVSQALVKPGRRIRTRPTASSRAERIESKRRTARKKSMRQNVDREDG
ncbi:MAG: alternative ribosome rescue aminoacyl-tRNA hydrolase ArfB [Desulfomonilia bacterium]